MAKHVRLYMADLRWKILKILPDGFDGTVVFVDQSRTGQPGPPHLAALRGESFFLTDRTDWQTTDRIWVYTYKNGRRVGQVLHDKWNNPDFLQQRTECLKLIDPMLAMEELL